MRGIVLNPHYKTLGLTGSEYHSYSLPKRVGENKAQQLLNNCLPISVECGKEIGVVDKVFSYNNYYKELHQFARVVLIMILFGINRTILEDYRRIIIESCKEERT